MITRKPRVGLLAVSPVLTGCGTGAAATPAHAPATPAPTASTPTPTPGISLEAAPQQVPGLGPTTRAKVPSEARQIVVVTGRGKDSPTSTVVLYVRAARGRLAGRRIALTTTDRTLLADSAPHGTSLPPRAAATVDPLHTDTSTEPGAQLSGMDPRGRPVPAHGVTLHTAPDGASWLDADPVRLRQVLGNLVTDAVCHTPPDGTVTPAVGATATRSSWRSPTPAPVSLPRTRRMSSTGSGEPKGARQPLHPPPAGR